MNLWTLHILTFDGTKVKHVLYEEEEEEEEEGSRLRGRRGVDVVVLSTKFQRMHSVLMRRVKMISQRR